jgi:hypothetical protein
MCNSNGNGMCPLHDENTNCCKEWEACRDAFLANDESALSRKSIFLAAASAMYDRIAAVPTEED